MEIKFYADCTLLYTESDERERGWGLGLIHSFVSGVSEKEGELNPNVSISPINGYKPEKREGV